jgi:hypothetical protein
VTDAEAREMARDLVRGSIIEDAAAQFIAQVLKHAHEDRIKPLRARITDLEAEVARLQAVVQAYEDMAPPPEPGALRRQLEKITAKRAAAASARETSLHDAQRSAAIRKNT